MTDPPSPPLPFCPAFSKQDAYQACRQWTIAVFQHITENDFAVRLLGASVKTLGAASYDKFYDDDNDVVNGRRRRRLLGVPENAVRSRYLAQTNGSYDSETNAGVDAVFSTVAIPALYSALPSTVSLLNDDYYFMDEVCGSCCLPQGTMYKKKGVEEPRIETLHG